MMGETREKNRKSAGAKNCGGKRRQDAAGRKSGGKGGRKNGKSGQPIRWKRWLWVIIPGLIMLALQFLTRKTTWFGTWYIENIFPFFVNTVGRVMSVFPFSVVEFGLYGFIIWVIWITVSSLYKGIRRKNRGIILLGSWLHKILTAAAVLLMVYTMTCGINYYAESFSSKEGFTVQKSSKEELIELCNYLVAQVNEAAVGLSTEDGGMLLTVDVQAEAVKAMEAAAQQYESLTGYYPRPKPVTVSWILSVQQLSGIYSPFTVEANYNRDMTDYNIPSTACHELSHLKGFAREDEANFIAYLACMASDSAEFNYSGAMLAYIHSINALYSTGDYEAWAAVRSNLCDMALRDLAANNAFWDRFEGKVAEVSNQVNNTYLQINNQSDGVKSYGRMVDLLLAMMREIKSGNASGN